MVVHLYGKGDNLYLHLRARSHTINVAQVGCSIFHLAKFDQTMTHQHVLSRRESLIDGKAVPIILGLHVLIAHRIFINFGYVDYFH